MNKLKLFAIAIVLILSTSSCNKTATEEVKFPNRVELVVGQYCLPQVVLDEYEYASGEVVSESHSSAQAGVIINGDTINSSTSSNSSSTNNHSTHKTYIFKNWVSNQLEIATTRGDTVVALSSGECELTAMYQDNLGEHSVICSVIVSDLDIPTAKDTIFIHRGVTEVLCNFQVPNIYTIHYDLEYEGGYVYSSNLNYYPSYNETSLNPSPLKLSQLYTYYLNATVPEQGFTSIRLYCEPLDIDVTVPIITLP